MKLWERHGTAVTAYNADRRAPGAIMAYALIGHDESHLRYAERKGPGVRIRKFRRLLKRQGIKYIETPTYRAGYGRAMTLFTYLPS